ncbi:MAG: IS110 family transposase [Clostridia bacterium]|nr:IS110 family transposase [Clostridia bacterium]
MISVGMDISKGKSTVCIRAADGSILKEPFGILHTEEDLDSLCTLLADYGKEKEVRVVMEATGVYHLPVLLALQEAGFFVCVVNPLLMKKFAAQSIRRGKNDKRDAIKIATYGLEKWYQLEPFSPQQEIYEDLRLLGRQYQHYIGQKIRNRQNLVCLLERTMPGVCGLLQSSHTGQNGKDKLLDFVEEYWHWDNVTTMNEEDFVVSYRNWARTNGYHSGEQKARAIYAVAMSSRPTLSSTRPCCHFLLQNAVAALRGAAANAEAVFEQMEALAVQLPEYETVRAMEAVGDVLAARLIAEIGDVRRFRSAGALVAYAGIDAPEFQSGTFSANQRHISKRGSSLLRKTGYEVMQSLKRLKCEQSPIYQYMLRKEQEGKPKKVAKIAGLNKFLRIYYARVSACCRQCSESQAVC